MPKQYPRACPSCGEKLKEGFTAKRTVALFSEKNTKIINKYFNKEAVAYCSRCGNDLWAQAFAEIKNKIHELKSGLYIKIDSIPIVTTHTPLNWDYDLLGIITGQSTTGTGVFAEIGSSITDFFGAQSGMYSDKLAKGETLCFNQLRRKAIAMGGNAVIAADIDYAEVGGAKGMLMVCMAGTAVRLKNPTVLGKTIAATLAEVTSILNDLDHYESFGIPADVSMQTY